MGIHSQGYGAHYCNRAQALTLMNAKAICGEMSTHSWKQSNASEHFPFFNRFFPSSDTPAPSCNTDGREGGTEGERGKRLPQHHYHITMHFSHSRSPFSFHCSLQWRYPPSNIIITLMLFSLSMFIHIKELLSNRVKLWRPFWDCPWGIKCWCS